MKKILLLEDNEAIIMGLVYALKQVPFMVEVCHNKKELIKQNIKDYDLLLLDIMLPDVNGLDLCKEIKKNYQIPIIFLTAKDEEEDIVLGFDLGCDDYVTKPFKTRELISRIKRLVGEENDVIKVQNVSLNLSLNKVYVDDKELSLTALEYKILCLLFTHRHHIITRDYILENIWDYDDKFVNDNTLTVYIKRLREKLGNDNIIKTVKGLGYRVDDYEER